MQTLYYKVDNQIMQDNLESDLNRKQNLFLSLL